VAEAAKLREVALQRVDLCDGAVDVVIAASLAGSESEPAALHMVLMVLTGWLDRRERHAVGYLIEENRCVRRHLRGRRLRLGRQSLPALCNERF
jgi:hypothetical protein